MQLTGVPAHPPTPLHTSSTVHASLSSHAAPAALYSYEQEPPLHAPADS